MNPFRKAAAAHSRAVDSVYGERLGFEPMRATGRMTAGGPDPSRARRVITGAVTERFGVASRRGEGSENGDNARIVARRWTVSIDGPLAASIELQPGDVIVRLDEPGAPRLRLAEPLPIPGRAVFPAEMV